MLGDPDPGLVRTLKVVIALVAAALEAGAARLRVLLRLEAPVLLPGLVAPAALRLLELLPLLRRAHRLQQASHCARRHVTLAVLTTTGGSLCKHHVT